ncbi:hypothetical protein D3C72_1405080 [compost metagenome]
MGGGAQVAEHGGVGAGNRQDLVVEAQVEDSEFRVSLLARIAQAGFHCLGHFGAERIGCRHRVELGVLHRAERGVVVGVERQRVIDQIRDVQRRQAAAVAQVERRVVGGAAGLAVGVDVLVAHARRDPPVAVGNAVIQVNRVRLGFVVEHLGAADAQARGQGDRIAPVLAGFVDVPVADGDIVRGGPPFQPLRVARLDAQHLVVARLVVVAARGGIDQRTLARAVVVIDARLELLRVRDGVQVADIDLVALALPVVGRMGVLERIVAVLRHGQAARRHGLDVVMRELAVDL